MRSLYLAAAFATVLGLAPTAHAADSLNACGLLRPAEATKALGEKATLARGDTLQTCVIRAGSITIHLSAYKMKRSLWDRLRRGEKRAAAAPPSFDDPCPGAASYDDVRSFGVPAYRTQGIHCGRVDRRIELYRHGRQLAIAFHNIRKSIAPDFDQLYKLARAANKRF